MDIGLIDADGHTEQWKSVAGYEGYYEVSDAGRVRSVDRSRIVNNRYGGQNRRVDKGREIAAVDNGNGYLYVTLSKDGSRRNHYVHRLVAEAFCTKQPNADVVNHINCNKKDDRACNLEWVTTMDNVRYTSDFMKKPKKTCAQSNTGEKYISRRNSRGHTEFRVYIRQRKICKSFKKLGEAVAYRNEVMQDGV